jgi:hypothetical protein
MMAPGDYLEFLRHDGAMLRIVFVPEDGFAATCTTPDGVKVCDVSRLTARAVSRAAERYVAGSVESCLAELRSAIPAGMGLLPDRVDGR